MLCVVWNQPVQVALIIEGQLKRLAALLGDTQVALIGRQIGCPYWVTNRLPLLGDKQVAFIGGQLD